MKRMLAVLVVMSGAIALLPKPCFSNAADPGPPPDKFKSVPFKITADPKTKENRLLIPRKFLSDLNLKTAGFFGNGEGGSNLRTAIAGVAISLSLVSLVFLLIKRKSRLAQAMAVLVAVGGAGFIWVNEAQADVAPPISEIPQTWKEVADSQKNVTIEITEKGDAVELILGTYRRRTLPPGQRRGPQQPGDGAKESGAAPK